MRKVGSGSHGSHSSELRTERDPMNGTEPHRAGLRTLGLCSYIVLPLNTGGRTLGAMTLAAAESGRRYTAADLVLAEELARRAAQAMDNARLYREARAAVRAREEARQQRSSSHGAGTLRRWGRVETPAPREA